MSELRRIQIRANPAIYGALKRIGQVRGKMIQECVEEAFLLWIDKNKLTTEEMERISKEFDKNFPGGAA